MLVKLTEEAYGCFTLYPVNKKLNRNSLFYQNDFDFPGLAMALGWKLSTVKPHPGCNHMRTDGTIKCSDCGATASEFIGKAKNWLHEHNGRRFRPYGIEEYFN